MYEKYKTQAKIRVSSYNYTSVCVQEGWTIRAHKWLISIKRGLLACSWSEHTVPESLGHVLVANQGGVEVVQLYERRKKLTTCTSLIFGHALLKVVRNLYCNVSMMLWSGKKSPWSGKNWLTSERKSIARFLTVVSVVKRCTTTAKSLCLASA